MVGTNLQVRKFKKCKLYDLKVRFCIVIDLSCSKIYYTEPDFRVLVFALLKFSYLYTMGQCLLVMLPDHQISMGEGKITIIIFSYYD